MSCSGTTPLVIHVAAGGGTGGGVLHHLLSLAPRLQAHGLRAEVAFLGGGAALELAEASGVCVRAVPKRGRGDLLAIPRLAKMLRRRGAALVHTHTLSTNFYGGLAASLARVPRRVTTVHSFVSDLRRYDVSGRLGNRLLSWHNRFMNRRADCLVAVSNGIRDRLLGNGIRPERIRLIRCGIALEDEGEAADNRQAARRDWGLTDEHWVIGNVARAHPVKDQMMLLESAIPLLRSDAAARLVIVGDGPELPRLRSRLRSEGLEERAMLPGAVPQARRLVAGFDVFALSSRMEGIPLAILEAMAAWRPVVATDVGGVGEVVIDGSSGLLVPARTPDAMREALGRLRERPDLAASLGTAGRRVVEENYDVTVTSRQIADLYRELLADEGERESIGPQISGSH